MRILIAVNINNYKYQGMIARPLPMKEKHFVAYSGQGKSALNYKCIHFILIDEILITNYKKTFSFF